MNKAQDWGLGGVPGCIAATTMTACSGESFSTDCHRSHINEAGGLEVYLVILRQQAASEALESAHRDRARVVREAAGGLLALLEDDHTKLQVPLTRSGLIRVPHFLQPALLDVNKLVEEKAWVGQSTSPLALMKPPPPGCIL